MVAYLIKSYMRRPYFVVRSFETINIKDWEKLVLSLSFAQFCNWLQKVLLIEMILFRSLHILLEIDEMMISLQCLK